MKPLKPSMREKKRYLFIEGTYSQKEINEAIMKYIGVIGYSKACPIWIEKNVLSVNREEIEKVKASLVFLKKLKIKKVSGTIRQVKK